MEETKQPQIEEQKKEIEEQERKDLEQYQNEISAYQNNGTFRRDLLFVLSNLNQNLEKISNILETEIPNSNKVQKEILVEFGKVILKKSEDLNEKAEDLVKEIKDEEIPTPKK